MELGWKVLSVSEREAVIKVVGGKIITIGTDASEGYSFVLDYLNTLAQNYGGHLRSADLLMQKLLGAQYSFICASERMYKTRLALLSLSCGFGGVGEGLDCSEIGVFNFRFVPCPMRSVCPVNGFSIKNRKEYSCCNPMFETNLTHRQRELTDLLVHTSYSYKDIAELLGIAEGRARNMSCEVFASMGVGDRQELTLVLKDRRFI